MTEIVKTLLTHFTYVALVLILFGAGMGVPIPEDVPLIFSGYLCHEDQSPLPAFTAMIDTDHDGIPDSRPAAPPARKTPHLSLMIIAGMVGVLGGDSILFFIGRRGIDSDNFIARHIRKVMHSKRRDWVESHFHTHGNLTILAGRFLPGVRSLVFATAGMSRMSFLRFALLDGTAALISVPLFILLGYHFAANINELFIWINHVKHILGPILLTLAAIAIALFILRKRRLSAVPASGSLPPHPSPDSLTSTKIH